MAKTAYLARADLGTGCKLARLQEPFVYCRMAASALTGTATGGWNIIFWRILQRHQHPLRRRKTAAGVILATVDRTPFAGRAGLMMDQQSRQRFIEMFHAHSD